MSNLTVRLVTAAIGIPIVLAVNYVGGWPFTLAIGLIAALGVWELCALFRRGGFSPAVALALPGTALAAVLPLHVHAAESGWIGILLVVMLTTGARSLLPRAGTNALINWALTVTGVVYIGITLGQLTLLRSWDRGVWWVVLVFVVTWGYDTGAYFAGRFFGKRPFMHHISSKKTLEGVQGGLLLAGAAGLLAVPALGLSVVEGIVLGVLCGVAAQTGDLVESMIKRQVHVKDSGTIIPGHGGLLDRIDSLLFTATIVVFTARVFGYGA